MFDAREAPKHKDFTIMSVPDSWEPSPARQYYPRTDDRSRSARDRLGRAIGPVLTAHCCHLIAQSLQSLCHSHWRGRSPRNRRWPTRPVSESTLTRAFQLSYSLESHLLFRIGKSSSNRARITIKCEKAHRDAGRLARGWPWRRRMPARRSTTRKFPNRCHLRRERRKVLFM